MTGGSDVRGKADKNLVRKVFNCLHSLYYRFLIFKIDRWTVFLIPIV
jgi:hypothetical protein